MKIKMFNSNLLFLTGLISLGKINCIVVGKTNSKTALEKGEIKKTDSLVAQSIDRDYIAVSGYDDQYGHGGYGLSSHANYGFPGNEGYAETENSKHHIHHSEDHNHNHHGYHKHYDHHDYVHHKALAIKSLLVPLAGVALLGAAAAFVSNPILLQLGVISGSSLGRRKRDTNFAEGTEAQEDRIRLKEKKLLEKFLAQIPQRDFETQEKKILANYLSCSGITKKNLCLERLVCELYSAEGTSMPMEAKVLTIVLKKILDNGFIPEENKTRLLKAAERGRENFACGVYQCQQLEEPPKQFITGN